MWQKVGWLTFWVTMVLWLGGMWGCAEPGHDQNYKLLEDRRPESPTDYDSSLSPTRSSGSRDARGEVDFVIAEPVDPAKEGQFDKHLADLPAHRRTETGATLAQAAADAPAPADTEVNTVTDDAMVADSPEAHSAGYAEEGWPIELPEATEPSIKPDSLDRSHWPRIAIQPEVGRTKHFPLYYKDYKPDRQVERIDFDTPVEQQLGAALANHGAHSWDRHHAVNFVIQHFKFGFDTVAAPFRMFQSPPWRTVTTPE